MSVPSAFQKAPGSVWLIGAGPGDADLLTVRAARAVGAADVVIHDRLARDAAVALARPDALRIEVGKTPFGPSWAQGDIDALMIRHARAGAVVARLKSGDPAIFGRLDEEIDALDAAGVAWTVIPGVTAACAAAAEAGASLTRRGRNATVPLITAQRAEGLADHDWRALAAPGAAAAVYMGVRAARFVQGRLMLHGADADMPVTVVENAGRPQARVLAARLAGLADAMEAARISGPAVLLLGVPARRATEAAAPSVLTLALAAGF